jgi:hypothetical protein
MVKRPWYQIWGALWRRQDARRDLMMSGGLANTGAPSHNEQPLTAPDGGPPLDTPESPPLLRLFATLAFLAALVVVFLVIRAIFAG